MTIFLVSRRFWIDLVLNSYLKLLCKFLAETLLSGLLCCDRITFFASYHTAWKSFKSSVSIPFYLLGFQLSSFAGVCFTASASFMSSLIEELVASCHAL